MRYTAGITTIIGMEPGSQPIPNRLKMHRKMMGYKQKEVAKLLGLYSSAPLSEWENGISMPNAHNLIKLSVLYRTYVNELYVEYCRDVRETLRNQEFALFERE